MIDTSIHAFLTRCDNLIKDYQNTSLNLAYDHPIQDNSLAGLAIKLLKTATTYITSLQNHLSDRDRKLADQTHLVGSWLSQAQHYSKDNEILRKKQAEMQSKIDELIKDLAGARAFNDKLRHEAQQGDHMLALKDSQITRLTASVNDYAQIFGEISNLLDGAGVNYVDLVAGVENLASEHTSLVESYKKMEEKVQSQEILLRNYRDLAAAKPSNNPEQDKLDKDLAFAVYCADPSKICQVFDRRNGESEETYVKRKTYETLCLICDKFGIKPYQS